MVAATLLNAHFVFYILMRYTNVLTLMNLFKLKLHPLAQIDCLIIYTFPIANIPCLFMHSPVLCAIKCWPPALLFVWRQMQNRHLVEQLNILDITIQQCTISISAQRFSTEDNNKTHLFCSFREHLNAHTHTHTHAQTPNFLHYALVVICLLWLSSDFHSCSLLFRAASNNAVHRSAISSDKRINQS